MTSFDGARAFITGGSSGIGEATARVLLERGASVMICGRDAAKLDAAVTRLRSAVRASRSVEALPLDVSDAEAVMQCAPRVLERLGGLDLLVNNAGITHPATAQDTTLELYRRQMEVNYFGTVHVTKAFLEHFVSQGSGQIAAVLSLAAVMGVYGYTAYAASKHALVGFFDTLRQEVAPHGIDVSLLFPGDTDTPMLEAENRIKPEATHAIAGNVPVLSADRVARSFVEGLAARRYHIVPGSHAKLVYYAQRHAPQVVRSLIDRDLAKVVRKRKR